jgi:Electron transfer DM13
MTSPRPRPVRRRLRWALLAVGAVVAIVAALVFEPWKLVLDEHVQEPPPSAAPARSAGAAAVVPGPVVLARGTFIGHEHDSSGSVEVLRLPDGSRALRLEDLRTSNGPLLEVWLADAPVVAGTGGWRVFDDGRHVSLGALKGNVGSSNYPIPPDVDPAELPSVSIWCARFHVSFAAAELRPVG